VPAIFTGLVGFAANLATAECYSLMMRTFDTSDLQVGMNGRPDKKPLDATIRAQRTNFTCYPRVSAAIAVTQFFKFLFAAVATAIGGRVERRYGAAETAYIVAAVLLALTLALTAVMYKRKVIQTFPTRSQQRETENTEEGWEPVVLGEPNGLTRKINILEAGTYTRWSELRRRNRLSMQLQDM
jgi:hypothetical protein